jgi:hypothetical protein
MQNGAVETCHSFRLAPAVGHFVQAVAAIATVLRLQTRTDLECYQQPAHIAPSETPASMSPNIVGSPQQITMVMSIYCAPGSMIDLLASHENSSLPTARPRLFHPPQQ